MGSLWVLCMCEVIELLLMVVLLQKQHCNKNKIGQVYTRLDKIRQVKTSWDKLGQTGSSWEKLGQVGTSKDKLG